MVYPELVEGFDYAQHKWFDKLTTREGEMNKTFKVITFSIVETAGLAIWLALLLGTLDFFLASRLVAFVVLSVFLEIEHLFSYNTAHGKGLFNFSGVPILKLL